MPDPVTSSPRPLITVAGDIIIDHHLYEGERRSATSEAVRGVTEVQEPGRAALIHALVQHLLLKESRDAVVLGTTVPAPHRHGDQHAFAIWKPYPRDAREAKSPSVWRVNMVMGCGPHQRRDRRRSGVGRRCAGRPLRSTAETTGLMVRWRRDLAS